MSKKTTPFGYRQEPPTNADKVRQLADDLIARKIKLTRKIADHDPNSWANQGSARQHLENLKAQLAQVDGLIAAASVDPVYEFILDQEEESSTVLERLERQYALPSTGRKELTA